MKNKDILGNTLTPGDTIKYAVAHSSNIHWKTGVLKTIEAGRAAVEVDGTKWHWFPDNPDTSYHEKIKRIVYLLSFDNTVRVG